MVDCIEFYHSENLLNCNNLTDIVNKIKELKKYQQLMIVRDDVDKTTAIIKIDDSNKKGFTKRDFVFHLPKSNKVTETFLNNTKSISCSICRDNLKKNEFIRTLPQCEHIFHKKCVDNWFYTSQKYECPLCRNNFYKFNKK